MALWLPNGKFLMEKSIAYNSGICNVYFRLKKGAGDATDVPEGVMESLEEMGWKQGGTIGQN